MKGSIMLLRGKTAMSLLPQDCAIGFKLTLAQSSQVRSIGDCEERDLSGQECHRKES